MDTLIAKLIGLSYDFVGIILPGLATTIFIFLYFAALGPVIESLSFGKIPSIQIENIVSVIKNDNKANYSILFLVLIPIWYFFGHSLKWLSRSGKPDDEAAENGFKRTWHFLRFRLLKPENNYHSSLDPLFREAKKKFETGRIRLTWRQFYPIAKTYISQNVKHSLYATYQNKYTLYRALSTLGVLSFWVGFIAVIAGAICIAQFGTPHPRWWLLVSILIISISIVWGFSAGYRYSWLLFGDTVIIEAYTLLFGPKIASNEESSSD